MGREKLKTKITGLVKAEIPAMVEVSQFHKLRYPLGKPCVRTLKNWINEGILLGEVRGGMYFVNAHAELLSTGNQELDSLIGM